MAQCFLEGPLEALGDYIEPNFGGVTLHFATTMPGNCLLFAPAMNDLLQEQAVIIVTGLRIHFTATNLLKNYVTKASKMC
jgi:hypothetical protein